MAESGIVTVDVDGIEVQVDLSYGSTWPALRNLSRMRSTDLPEFERAMATTEYYDHMCPNNGEVYRQVVESAADGEDANARAMAVMAEAVRKAVPKA